MSMTRKDFILIADVLIKTFAAPGGKQATAVDFANNLSKRLGETNPNFDPDRFVNYVKEGVK